MSVNNKEYIIERRQLDAKGNIKVISRDFFDDLPQNVTSVLNEISWRWRNYDWFEEAWNKYREHVLNAVSNGNPIKAPGFIFNSYIDDQVRADYEKEMSEADLACLHSEDDIDVLMHYNPNHDPETGQFTSSGDDSEKQWRENIKKWKQENEDAKVVKEHNANLNYEKEQERIASEKDFNNSIKMLESGRNITKEMGTIVVGVQGTKRTNPKETKIKDDRPYKDITDAELAARVRRMQLERQYGDLTGDAKYEQTGKEKTREHLQTIGALLGIGISALTIYKLIHDRTK